ncbi:MAG: nucleoside triphosphate pyrophosphohydrolase family protein [Candidatus Micrarchaeota archaeon]|nr:nucleoside triphosphate pyrophosphohydrolase family protein [Candidatus Micrarchaeota archaeon]MDE1859587.1 nucleoside triphosphate pyrophosphohydrolase family protein [Candidatus Micrarchaeota archaeon]
MNFDEYQSEAKKTAIYPQSAKITYPIIGLAGEVGELCNKYKKTIRDGRVLDKEEIAGEIGDIAWYLAMVCEDFGVSFDEVARKNIEKLKDRQSRGAIKGSGDNR